MPRRPLVAALLAGLFVCSATTRALAAWSHDSAVNNVVCNAYNSQSGVAIAPDGAGGEFLAWADHRWGTADDIDAQHLNSAGSPMWAANGVLVCGALGEQGSPAILPDGTGGLFVAWEDSRSGASGADIYAQRVTAAGGVAFPANGYAYCTAPNPQLEFAAPSPNPARGTTTLRFSLPQAGMVKLALYDAAGRRVTIVHDGLMEAGARSATLALRDGAGRERAAGLYLARLEAQGRTLTRRIAIVR